MAIIRLLIITFMFSYPVFAGADRKDYDDCILEHMKGVTSNIAANSIRSSCSEKYLEKIEEIPDVSLPSDVLSRLEGKGWLGEYGLFQVRVYNNDEDWCISSIVVRILDSTTEKYHDYEHVFYSLANKYPVCPKSWQSISFAVFDMPKPFAWGIVSGKGYKKK